MRIILAYIQSQLILILYWNYNHATQKAIMAKFDKIPNVPGTDKIFYSKLLVFSIGNFISLEICRLKSLLIKSLIRIRSKYLSFWWNIGQSKIEEQSTLKNYETLSCLKDTLSPFMWFSWSVNANRSINKCVWIDNRHDLRFLLILYTIFILIINMAVTYVHKQRQLLKTLIHPIYIFIHKW